MTYLSPNDTANLLSAGTGTLLGFLVRAQQNRHEISLRQLELLLTKFEKNLIDQRDARHTHNKSLEFMRFIMIAALSGGIFILFLLPGFYHWPVNIETIHQTGFFSKLFHGNEDHIWHSFHGLVIPNEFWQLCFYMSGFLFGGRR